MRQVQVAEWRRGAARGRPPAPADLPGYRALLADPEVRRWLWWRSFDDEEIRRWHEADLRHWDEHGFGPWALEPVDGAGEAAAGAAPGGAPGMVGRGGIRHGELDGEPVVELVWAVASSHQGRGLARASASAGLEVADELGLTWVIALIESANAASCRVAEAAGLRLERQLPYDGRPHRLYRSADPTEP